MNTAAVNLQPILAQLLSVAGIILTSVLIYVAQRAGTWLTSKGIAVNQASWDATLMKAGTFGVQVSNSIIASKGWDHIDSHNAIINAGANYLVDHEPAALASVGLSTDMTDPKNVALIKQALQRVLPDVVTKAAESPATPPAPATATAAKAAT